MAGRAREDCFSKATAGHGRRATGYVQTQPRTTIGLMRALRSVRRWPGAALLTGAALILAGCGAAAGVAPPPPPVQGPLTFSVTTTTPTSTVATPTARPYLGPEGLPIETGPFLAPSTTTALGRIVDGIQCQHLAQLAYTSYAHLQVYVNGRARAIPGGVGLVDQSPIPTAHGLFYGASACMYWLHTRAADGLIDVQSPVPRRFTLGQLFRIWSQPLNRRRVAGARGVVTAYVNGKRWPRSPASIPLTAQAVIQLAVGRPVPPPQSVDWVSTSF